MKIEQYSDITDDTVMLDFSVKITPIQVKSAFRSAGVKEPTEAQIDTYLDYIEERLGAVMESLDSGEQTMHLEAVRHAIGDYSLKLASQGLAMEPMNNKKVDTALSIAYRIIEDMEDGDNNVDPDDIYWIASALIHTAGNNILSRE